MTDHPRELAVAILNYTPTIARHGEEITMVFDSSDEAIDAHKLLWRALDSVIDQVSESEDDVTESETARHVDTA